MSASDASRWWMIVGRPAEAAISKLTAKSPLLCFETWSCSRKIEPRFSDGNGMQNLDRLLQIPLQ